MPTPAAIVFRPGRRSHRGRPGRRGNRSRFRVDFAGHCSASWEAAPSSASPVSAASRSLARRARAASARASALATSSSPSTSETGAMAPGSAPERDCGSSGSVTSAGSSQWSASGRSGSCTEKELITSARAQRRHRQLPSCPPHAEMRARQGAGRGGVRVARRRRLSGSGVLLQPGEFSFQVWHSNRVRFIVAMAAALLGAGVLAAPPSFAGPTVCDYPACTPGIMPHQVLGAPCDNTTYYAFGVDDSNVPPASQPGRLMFCGSPRKYQPRWFRSPPMAGVKDEGAGCQNYQNYVAQAPDGLFLICYAHDGVMTWIRADT